MKLTADEIDDVETKVAISVGGFSSKNILEFSPLLIEAGAQKLSDKLSKLTPEGLREKIAKKLLKLNHNDLIDLSQESEPCRLGDHWCRYLGNEGECKLNNKPVKSLTLCPDVWNTALKFSDSILSLFNSQIEKAKVEERDEAERRIDRLNKTGKKL